MGSLRLIGGQALVGLVDNAVDTYIIKQRRNLASYLAGNGACSENQQTLRVSWKPPVFPLLGEFSPLLLGRGFGSKNLIKTCGRNLVQSLQRGYVEAGRS